MEFLKRLFGRKTADEPTESPSTKAPPEVTPARHPELEAALRQNPDDVDAHLVYADSGSKAKETPAVS
ncbi:MAG: hypothetical protein HN348_11305 [Proteobacteria bacterium]|jgi:hypothetical protein|nr:hypothetical protein [Pseudomonadota bacterium]